MKLCVFLLVSSMVVSSCKKKAGAEAPAQGAKTEDAVPGGQPAPVPSPTDTVTPTPTADTRPVAATVNTNRFDCDILDFGLYWFGKGDMAQKVSPTTRSTFYDPSKPTIIYAHGWQANSHILRKRGTFNYNNADPLNGPKVDEADAWIAAGWNVGMFYWNQLADDNIVNTIEDRIWLDKPITWKNCKGEELTTGIPGGNVTDMLYNAYIEGMRDYRGPNVRFAGHSLGSQLVTRVAFNLSKSAKEKKIDQRLVPKRVALLDPFWAAGTFLQVSRASLVSSLIASLKAEGMIFEWYKTSNLSEVDRADPNLALISMIGRTEAPPDWYSAMNSISRHGAAIYTYFQSFASPPPPGCRKPCIDPAPSAATSDERMLELMNAAAIFKQVRGTDTPITSDNTFERMK